MKARPSKLFMASRVAKAPFLINSTSRSRCSIILATCWSLSFRYAPLNRNFSPSTNTLNLADRIRQIFPDDATETSESEEMGMLLENDVQDTSLAAYEAEVASSIALLEKFKYKEGCTLLLNTLPLQAVLTALSTRIVPLVTDSVTGQLGLVELAYSLYEQGHSALASQMLMASNLRSVNLEQKYFAFVRDLKSLSSHPNTAELDHILHSVTGHHFPQILSDTKISLWLKSHLLAVLQAEDFNRWLKNYGSHFDPAFITMTTLLLPTSEHFTALADWLVPHKQIDEFLPPVLSAISSIDNYKRICRRVMKHHTDNARIASAMLATAIRFRQTYDIANICKEFSHSLHHPRDDSLLAKALLAAAFAQRKPASDKDINELVTAPDNQLHTFLVRRTLSPVIDDENARNIVIGRAATRLLYMHPKGVPGNVLWQLLSSLPGPIAGPANGSLAKLLVKRPYVEQIRYMSMPTVSVGGIISLLKWHIIKIIEYRKVNGVNPELPQAKEDIQLMVVGMLLATEKQAVHTPQATKASGVETPSSLSHTVAEIFENNSSSALELHNIAEDHKTRQLSASIAFYVVAELVKQKSYTVAKQLLKYIGPKRISQNVFNNLLLNLARDKPEDIYAFVLWLVKFNKISVQPTCINEVLYILSKSPDLSESQLANRFQNMRMLLRTHLKANISPKSAIALVDALLRSSISREGGSRLRLKWALDVAKESSVPEREFDRWSSILEQMQENKRGYWAND